MNILVIGSGGREHAICWKLQQSAKVSNVYVLPGSDAIAALPKTSCVKQLNVKDFKVSIDELQSRKTNHRNQLLLSEKHERK